MVVSGVVRKERKTSTVVLRVLFPISIVAAVTMVVGWNHLLQTLAPPCRIDHDAVVASIAPRRQRKIYIDLGVNCGNSYYRFKEGSVIGSSTTLRDNADWEAYLWEANPQMIEWYLNDLVEKERANGMNVHLIPKAAYTKETTISFYLTKGQEIGTKKEKLPNANCSTSSVYNPSGASTVYGGAKRAGQEIQVPAVDFLAWFKSLQLQAGDIVHLKSDIEGAELDIVEAFMADTTNQICFWSQFWTEYHSQIFPNKSEEQKRHVEFEKNLPSRFEEKCGRRLWPNGVLK